MALTLKKKWLRSIRVVMLTLLPKLNLLRKPNHCTELLSSDFTECNSGERKRREKREPMNMTTAMACDIKTALARSESQSG
jgi:hypothetical protein